MWKKEEAPAERPTAEQPRPGMPTAAATEAGKATIGPSISIRGDVTGSEDLLIQGQVDGSVTLDLHAVAVGSEGRVNANITGRVITIEGEVEGDLTAKEQIVLLGTARVHGDIKAPSVVLQDGATYRGLIDMGNSTGSGGATVTADDDETGSGNGASATKAASGGGDEHDTPSKSGGVPKHSSPRSAPARPSSGGGKGASGAAGQAGA